MRLLVAYLLLISLSFAQKELKIGFPKPIPPYIFDDKSGIEIELFMAIMKPYGYKIKPILMSFKRGKKSVVTNKLDAMSTMTKDDNKNIYYSNEYIRYHNYAVSLKEKNFKIDDLDDLKGKSIVTCQNAHTMLGNRYYEMFNNRVKDSYIKKYREMVDQGQQNRLFWANRIDIIILDKGIFEYYKKLYSKELNTNQDVVLHDIISKYTGYSVAFKDKKLRDEYNNGLKRIKANGTYKKIFAKYK